MLLTRENIHQDRPLKAYLKNILVQKALLTENDCEM